MPPAEGADEVTFHDAIVHLNGMSQTLTLTCCDACGAVVWSTTEHRRWHLQNDGPRATADDYVVEGRIEGVGSLRETDD